MGYSLQDFCRETREILKSGSSRAVVEKISPRMERLVADREFVAKYFGPQQPEGLHKIHVDAELGFEVMTYRYEKARQGQPHDHGDSWAIYAQVGEYTDMIEWDRLDDGSDPNTAKVKSRKSYRLNPGQAGVYFARELHSASTSPNTRYLRVTGTDLENIERLRINAETGRIERIRAAQTNSAVAG